MKIASLILLTSVLMSCEARKTKDMLFDRAAYFAEVETWHKKRVENLKGPEGWLNLAGLYWLKEGINTFGSGNENDIVFPEGMIDPKAGVFILKQGRVTLNVSPGVTITSGNQPVKSRIVYPSDSSGPVRMRHNSFEWFVIKRDDKFGIRLRDFESPAVTAFGQIDRYAIDPAWRISASLELADSTKTIEITNVLGQTFQQRSPGTLVFYIKDKQYRLDALDEGGEEYFIIFGDSTNARETYGAGRYLYVNRIDSAGSTIIDFNKAYNPPCAFTAFATCPLPPKQNILDVAVTAGEKNYGVHQ
jgi:uncharacterized protein (DUF1684 family)